MVLMLILSMSEATCWVSIAEVIALAMNSSPSATLRKIFAGITEFHLFQLPVRVLTCRDGESESEHLELVFGNAASDAPTNLTKANRTYKTMPSSKQHAE